MNELNIGKLNKRISIYEYVIIEGRLGNDKSVLKELYQRWAEITPLKNKEQIVDYHDQGDLTYKIIIRWFDGLTQKHYIGYNNKIYNITSVIDINMQHNFYEILCKEEIGKTYEFYSED